MSKKLTTEEFIDQAKKIHGNKYNYSSVVYKDNTSKVIIACPQHGLFSQTPNSHKSGQGCKTCGLENQIKKRLSTKEDFIKKSIKIHGDKYDYSRVLYTHGGNKVAIGCNEHGWFEQIPYSHLNGRGCKSCGREKISKKQRLSTKEFILMSKKIHGGKYNYSKVSYKTNKLRVIIGCKVHGWFEQNAGHHLNGRGCKKCGSIETGKKLLLTKKDFIKKSKKIHSNRYNYSRVDYNGGSKSVTIGCDLHGWFNQNVNNHMSGSNCPKCAMISSHKLTMLDLEDFISRSNKVHSNKYDYSKVLYKGSKIKIIIICPIHGEFEQQPNVHLSGSGCKECGNETIKKLLLASPEDFIKKSKKIHGDKYNYSKVDYKGESKSITIGCDVHGWFNQTAHNHVQGAGCPKCYNKSEGKIAEYLITKFIIFRGHKIGDKNKYYDFYLPDYNLLIERDGEQHYHDKTNFFSKGKKGFIKKQQDNDRYKTELAKKHGYKIARIPFWLNDKQVEREIENILSDNPTYPDVPDLKQVKTKPLPK